MDHQGFDPIIKTPAQVVDFLENIEMSEDFDHDKLTKSAKDDNKKNKKQKHSNSNNDNKGGGGKFCLIHGKCGHTSNDCTKLQDLAKKGKPSGSDKDKGSKNKSWTRKADDNKKKTKNELNALVQKAVQKEVNNMNKKRKSDDEDDDDLYAIERELNAVDLNGFNIEDLKKSMVDDEISV